MSKELVIEVGGIYLNRLGHEIEIVKDLGTKDYPFECNFHEYAADGKFYEFKHRENDENTHDLDLVERIK